MNQKIKIVAIIILFFVTSCSKDFDEINIDPTQFKTATPEAALQGSFKRLIDLMGNNNPNKLWDVSNLINAGTRYDLSDGGMWQTMYINVLQPVNQVKITYGEDPDFSNRVQIARIWEAYSYFILTTYYGPIPLSQALDLEHLSTIMYDSEDEVFTYVLNTLKDAVSKLDETKTTDKLVYDAIFGKTAAPLLNWKKFANTLRLKIALTCSKSLPTLSQETIRAVMSNEANTISAETESARLQYENVINNENPNYIRYVRNTVNPSVDPPAMNDNFFVYFRSYNDPRLNYYFDSVPVVNRYVLTDTLASTLDDSLRVVTYKIPHLGRPKSTITIPGWTALNGVVNPMAGINKYSYSRPAGYGYNPANNQAEPANFTAPDRPFTILSYAEACFYKAEAAALGLGGSKSAEQYYYEGIDANFAFWKVRTDLRDAYKQRDGIKWGTSGKGLTDFLSLIHADIPDVPLTKIYIQEWFNYFPDQAFEAWCLQRRTRAIDLTPHTNPGSGFVSTPYIDIPLRGIYPTNSLQLNPTGYNDALAKLGTSLNDNNPYLKLNFVKDYVVPDWNQKPVAYNMILVRKWYGNTIQDLTSAGVAYTVINSFHP